MVTKRELGFVAGPVIQAIGRLTFEDDLRSGQGRHGEFEPGKVQIFFDWLFLIRVFLIEIFISLLRYLKIFLTFSQYKNFCSSVL